MFKTLYRGGAQGVATVIKDGVLIVTYNDSVPQTKYVEISYSTVKGPRMELYIRKNANQKKCEVAVDLTRASLEWNNDNNPAFICGVLRDRLKLRLDMNADRPDLATHVGDWQAVIQCSYRPAEMFAVRCISLPYPGPAVIHTKQGQTSVKVDYFTHRVMEDYTSIEEVEVHDAEITLQVNKRTISLLAVRPNLVHQCLKSKQTAFDRTKPRTPRPSPPTVSYRPLDMGYTPMGYTPMGTVKTIELEVEPVDDDDYLDFDPGRPVPSRPAPHIPTSNNLPVDESEYFDMSGQPSTKSHYPAFGLVQQRSVEEAEYLTYDPDDEHDEESIYFDPSLGDPLLPPAPVVSVEPPPIPSRPSGPLSRNEFKDELVRRCGLKTSSPSTLAADPPNLPRRTGAEVIRHHSKRGQKPRTKRTKRPSSTVGPPFPPPPDDMPPPPPDILPALSPPMNRQDLPPPPPSISPSPLSPPLPKRRVEPPVQPKRASIESPPRSRPPIPPPEPRLNRAPPRSERPPLPPPTASPPPPPPSTSLESPYMDQIFRPEAPPVLRQRPRSTILFLEDGTVYTMTTTRPNSIIDRPAIPPPPSTRAPLPPPPPPPSTRAALPPPPTSERPPILPPFRRGPLAPPPSVKDRVPLLPPNSQARTLPSGSNRRGYR